MCHQHWPEIGSEGLGQADTEENTDSYRLWWNTCTGIQNRRVHLW